MVATGVSDEDYPRVCATVYCVLEAKTTKYLTKIFQCLVAWFVLSIGGRALGVSNRDYPKAGGQLCTMV